MGLLPRHQDFRRHAQRLRKRDAVLAACDADDGVHDGMVAAFDQCTDRKVLPLLSAKTCHGEKTLTCLSAAQIHALEEMHAGPRDAHNQALYSDWQWDAGIARFGWRLWKLGSADGKIPALNIALGGSSLAAVFTTPPTPVPNDLQANLDFQLGFDFAHDAGKINTANTAGFSRSAWQEIGARSSDLAKFRARGGKLLVPHGVSDPVFSIRDTLAWYGEVDRQSRGNAAQFVRVFPVPGMNHCAGGPATDNFDAFSALQTWVEHKSAPDRIIATAGPTAPWPGRTRPLCPYPMTAHYRGSGNIEKESSFECK